MSDGGASGGHPNGDTRPNGHGDPDEMEDLDEAIVAYARKNPTKTAAVIAKHFGQPKTVVEELLPSSR